MTEASGKLLMRLQTLSTDGNVLAVASIPPKLIAYSPYLPQFPLNLRFLLNLRVFIPPILTIMLLRIILFTNWTPLWVGLHCLMSMLLFRVGSWSLHYSSAQDIAQLHKEEFNSCETAHR